MAKLAYFKTSSIPNTAESASASHSRFSLWHARRRARFSSAVHASRPERAAKADCTLWIFSAARNAAAVARSRYTAVCGLETAMNA